ncbi:CmpA/NrtA family ABC transporter substrate-binding protein [Pollutimonas harenae]|uniref:ABC transporter substrate-binding protein n=1 Tax=Pollutimonas harenae TaxID=657015 RepID=A0A853H1W3_9BURK|nr:CmpA/NrtA family ABC transporter substrate-binding protein [Pollutimonas harenae]NYT84563.1 ABC transporter substrate-binding protein [Pollutimonas harenae]TEA73044.1 nitrate ABC transporter substrate-binding protein [Pollutimonas harenae]
MKAASPPPPASGAQTIATSQINGIDQRRRALLGASAAAGLGALSLMDPLIRATAWAAGSDAPEKTEVKIGFIPLTDCASVVMASVLGFDKKHGVKIIPTKEASWAGVREKLTNGDLDFAHVLYGLIYGMQLGLAGAQQDMAVLMGLNQNGQGITLSNQLREAGVIDGESLARKIAGDKRPYTFAHTFPTGTHAMWLYYWLASHGIDPGKTRNVTVPPPQMVANMRIGNVDGYCVGEPWNARAIIDKVGFSAATSQDIWVDHPEKVLGTRANFVASHPHTVRAVTAAILEASRWIDSSPDNLRKTAETIAAKSYVNANVGVIMGRMLGQYENGLGKSWSDAHAMRFHGEGAVNFPYLSDGMWFLTQHKRWGILKEHPNYRTVAQQVNRIDTYKEAAAAANIALPASESRSSKLLDGVVWDGSDPAGYADGFVIKA